ncbi:hypothetical protein [Mycobacteroides immunogenum]|nr:hypothetical protein [Mycobacteroides immunogenum]KPG31825.1 hypothetical protein AN914_26000 [Mycobacteroides immunogenum]KPG39698.1 hypothetical protein AN915_26550 [Mycobacteroides immunogenum]
MDWQHEFDSAVVERRIARAKADEDIRQNLKSKTKGLFASVFLLGVVPYAAATFAAVALASQDRSAIPHGLHAVAAFVGHRLTPAEAKDGVIALLALVAAINIALSVDIAARLRHELIQLSQWRNQFRSVLLIAAFAAVVLGVGQWFGLGQETKNQGQAFVVSILALLTVRIALATADRVNSVDNLADLLRADESMKQLVGWRIGLHRIGIPDIEVESKKPGLRSRLCWYARFAVLPTISAIAVVLAMYAVAGCVVALTDIEFGDWRQAPPVTLALFCMSVLLGIGAALLTVALWSSPAEATYRRLYWRPVLIKAALVAFAFGFPVIVSGALGYELAERVFFVSSLVIVLLGGSGVVFLVLWVSRVNPRPVPEKLRAKLLSATWLSQPVWRAVAASLASRETSVCTRFREAFDRQDELEAKPLSIAEPVL